MRVVDDIVAQDRELATLTIANALDDLEFAGVMGGLAQIVPGPRCVGRAVTIRRVTGARGDFGSGDFKVGDMIEAAAPGDILLIDHAGHCVSTFGGLATLAAKRQAIAGVIVDGGGRDREEMLEQRLPVFARHMTPLTGRTRIAISAINQPVSCGGVRGRAGDLIVADGSGVICIPAEHAAEVARLAANDARDDAAAAVELARGLSFRQAMAKFTRI